KRRAEAFSWAIRRRARRTRSYRTLVATAVCTAFSRSSSSDSVPTSWSAMSSAASMYGRRPLRTIGRPSRRRAAKAWARRSRGGGGGSRGGGVGNPRPAELGDDRVDVLSRGPPVGVLGVRFGPGAQGVLGRAEQMVQRDVLVVDGRDDLLDGRDRQVAHLPEGL